MAMREQAVPAPAAGEVLVKVTYAGICGSELGGYLGHNALRVPPLVMGHEFAGEIAALGDGATARNPALFTGQAVTVNPLSYCGQCDYCKQGLNHLCARRKLLGAHRPGAYAEYVTTPAENVVPLPAGVTARTGALTEPVAVAVRMAELAGPVAGETVLIVGAGPIGLLALQALRARGAGRIFISDLEPQRLAMAEELGGEPLNARDSDVVKTVRGATGNRGPAVSVDAVGAGVTRQQAVTAARAGGTVILTGLHEEQSALNFGDVIRREVVLRGSFAYSPANFAEGLDWLARGAIRLDPWIVEAPLADGGRWFDRLIDEPGGVAKVLLIP
ncbi:MAG: alcohol dehydrogenase catalytic domain-containing protein [Chloroflexi bacterium]|nr:alcohol dehydrogenase catalytic domain-containing protein [Chloroflexota bacterium]